MNAGTRRPKHASKKVWQSGRLCFGEQSHLNPTPRLLVDDKQEVAHYVQDTALPSESHSMSKHVDAYKKQQRKATPYRR